MCSCYQDCHEYGPDVCASDARMYASQCHMEVHACHKDIHLEEMPLKYCEGGYINISIHMAII
jgi:hypothetical protein